jgi:hypothetical protein
MFVGDNFTFSNYPGCAVLEGVPNSSGPQQAQLSMQTCREDYNSIKQFTLQGRLFHFIIADHTLA